MDIKLKFKAAFVDLEAAKQFLQLKGGNCGVVLFNCGKSYAMHGNAVALYANGFKPKADGSMENHEFIEYILFDAVGGDDLRQLMSGAMFYASQKSDVICLIQEGKEICCQINGEELETLRKERRKKSQPVNTNKPL